MAVRWNWEWLRCLRHWDRILLAGWIALSVAALFWAVSQTYDGRNLRALTLGLIAADSRTFAVEAEVERLEHLLAIGVCANE